MSLSCPYFFQHMILHFSLFILFLFSHHVVQYRSLPSVLLYFSSIFSSTRSLAFFSFYPVFFFRFFFSTHGLLSFFSFSSIFFLLSIFSSTRGLVSFLLCFYLSCYFLIFFLSSVLLFLLLLLTSILSLFHGLIFIY